MIAPISSSMFPDPWRTNPVGRFWDRLRGRDVTPRYLSRLTKEQQANEQKWRTVGSIRRYILLLLTVAQTVVPPACSFMQHRTVCRLRRDVC
jgi:membrane glycosyltransferase